MERIIERTDHPLTKRLSDLYSGVNDLIEEIDAGEEKRVILTGGGAAGSIPASDALLSAHILIALVGGIPVAVAKWGSVLCGTGGDGQGTAAFSGSISGTALTYTASAAPVALKIIV